MISVLDADELARLAAVNEAQRDSILMDHALGWIAEHPLRFAQLTLERLYYFWWAPPTHGHPAALRTASLGMYMLQSWAHAPFLVFGLIGVWYAWRTSRRSVLALLFVLATFTIVYAVSVASFRRYRLPSEVALILLSSVGIDLVLEWLSVLRHRAAIVLRGGYRTIYSED
jgi:hypothetical protein